MKIPKMKSPTQRTTGLIQCMPGAVIPKRFDAPFFTHTHTHTHIYIYKYIYTYVLFINSLFMTGRKLSMLFKGKMRIEKEKQENNSAVSKKMALM